MTGKEEIQKKGYMEGIYVVGQGKAHGCFHQHQSIFNCDVCGTFNIKLNDGQIIEFEPTLTSEHNNYWFIKISKDKMDYFGWAVRGKKSNQKHNIIELVTKQLLPDSLKEDKLAVIPLEKWDEKQIRIWSEEKYWFQTFSFSPKQRADSEYVWNIINKIKWKNLSVFDIGSHYGFFSFKASKAGASVLGVEPNKSSIKCASTIRDHIIQQDVNFVRQDPYPSKKYDVILFLSVFHQIDPTYKDLEKQMNDLKSRTIKHLFVELIMPPMFPQGSNIGEEEIDRIVGGQILDRYTHKVRGDRKIYWWKNG
jgi:hypothetical protein